jgi:iron complex outermembrane receptor protein
LKQYLLTGAPPVPAQPVLRPSGPQAWTAATRRCSPWLALWLLPALATADELLLRDIPSVFAASGFEQSASDAPSSVSVLTAADIERFGWRTLAEALGSLRGFDTRYDHAYDYVGVRGLQRPGDWNRRILLLIDGHRINENVYGQALLGNDAVVDLGAVERIEVVRGPGSSLYGASAVLAVVDVVTKRGRDYRGLQAEVHAGAQDTRAFRVGGGNRIGDLEFAGAVSGLDRGGAERLYFPALASLTPTAGLSSGADAEHNQRLLGSLRWKAWSLQAASVQWRKQLPQGIYGTALSEPRNLSTQERSYLRLGYDDAVAPATRLRLAWSADRYSYRGTYVLSDYSDHDAGDGTWNRAEAAVEHRLGERTRVTAGLDVQRDRRIRQFNFDIYGTRIDDQRHGHVVGTFVQAEHAFTPLLRVNVGLRRDHYSTFGGTTSPRLGLIWQPAEGHALKLLQGGAYRAPNAFEFWFDDNGLSHRSNPGLRPERIRSRELVWEARWSERLQTTLSAYRNALRDLIEQVTDPASGLLQSRNTGAVDSTGLEAQVDARLGTGVEARLSASWQNSRIPNAALPLSNSPHWLLKGSLMARLGAQGTLALESRSSSSVYTLAGERLPGYTLLNLTASSPLGSSGWRGSVSLFNALDRAYAQPAGQEFAPQTSLPQFGRLWLLRLEKTL